MGRSVAVALALLAGLAPAPAHAQSARDVVERMLAEYEKRSEGVHDYTLVQEVMGLETHAYFEKQMRDGRPVFQLVRMTADGVAIDTPDEAGVDELVTMGEELAERATYLGRDRINDYEVHVLEIPDLSDTRFGRGFSPDTDFKPTRGRLYLDTDTYVFRRVSFEGEVTNAQGTTQVTNTVDMGDYRETHGLLIPYATEIKIEGIGAAIDPETRAQFERMQRELENMPEAQRAMVERMMADQIKQFAAMMSDEAAPMTIRVLVREVRVNTGPPS